MLLRGALLLARGADVNAQSDPVFEKVKNGNIGIGSLTPLLMSVTAGSPEEGLEALRPIRHEVIVPISGLHRGVIAALEYAKSIAPHHVTAIYVNLDDETTQKLREKWQQWGSGVNLVVVASPYRSLLRPLLNYVDRVKRSSHGEVVTIVLPEFVPARWWQNLLHNQNTLLLKGALLFKRGVVVTNVPYHLEH